MRDLNASELGHVYGAGGKGSCRPRKSHNPCRGGGRGSGSRGRGSGSGGRGSGSRGRKNRCKGGSSS